MICCKIIADYSNTEASFSKLCEFLAKKGDFLWSGNVMYFADTEGDTTEKKITTGYKKAGYTKIFIDPYDVKTEPREDESVKGWITDKLTKIYYQQYERENQAVFKNIDKGLDALNIEIDKLAEQAKQEHLEPETTEDNK